MTSHYKFLSASALLSISICIATLIAIKTGYPFFTIFLLGVHSIMAVTCLTVFNGLKKKMIGIGFTGISFSMLLGFWWCGIYFLTAIQNG